MNAVVYNACYGGFSLSLKAVDWLEQNAKDESLVNYIKDMKQTTNKLFWGDLVGDHLPRHHKDLVAVIEALGDGADGDCAELCIAHISGNQYRIEEYDGAEEVVTPEESDWIFIKDGE